MMIDAISAVAASQLLNYWYGMQDGERPAKHGDSGSVAPILRRLVIAGICMGLLVVQLTLLGPS